MKKVLLIVCLSLLIAVPAVAKEGLYLGANLVFNDIGGDISGVDAGNGVGLRAGAGLNRYLAIEANIFESSHDTTGGGSIDFSGATLDLKLDFPLTGSNIVPYLRGGIGSYEIDSVDGTGTQLGFGMDIYFFPELSFNAGLTRRDITFDYSGGDVDAKVITLDFGISYHFI